MNYQNNNQNRNKPNQNSKRNPAIGRFEKREEKPTQNEKTLILGISRFEDPAPIIGLANSSFETLQEEKTKPVIVVVANCEVVNVRERPDRASGIQMKAKKGTRFELLSQSNGWAKVSTIELPSWIGYIVDTYVVGE